MAVRINSTLASQINDTAEAFYNQTSLATEKFLTTINSSVPPTTQMFNSMHDKLNKTAAAAASGGLMNYTIKGDNVTEFFSTTLSAISTPLPGSRDSISWETVLISLGVVAGLIALVGLCCCVLFRRRVKIWCIHSFRSKRNCLQRELPEQIDLVGMNRGEIISINFNDRESNRGDYEIPDFSIRGYTSDDETYRDFEETNKRIGTVVGASPFIQNRSDPPHHSNNGKVLTYSESPNILKEDLPSKHKILKKHDEGMKHFEMKGRKLPAILPPLTCNGGNDEYENRAVLVSSTDYVNTRITRNRRLPATPPGDGDLDSSSDELQPFIDVCDNKKNFIPVYVSVINTENMLAQNISGLTLPHSASQINDKIYDIASIDEELADDQLTDKEITASSSSVDPRGTSPEPVPVHHCKECGASSVISPRKRHCYENATIQRRPSKAPMPAPRQSMIIVAETRVDGVAPGDGNETEGAAAADPVIQSAKASLADSLRHQTNMEEIKKGIRDILPAGDLPPDVLPHKPQNPIPKPQNPIPKPQTPNPKLQTSNLKPQTPIPKPQTPNHKPQTRNPGSKVPGGKTSGGKSSGGKMSGYLKKDPDDNTIVVLRRKAATATSQHLNEHIGLNGPLYDPVAQRESDRTSTATNAYEEIDDQPAGDVAVKRRTNEYPDHLPPNADHLAWFDSVDTGLESGNQTINLPPPGKPELKHETPLICDSDNGYSGFSAAHLQLPDQSYENRPSIHQSHNSHRLITPELPQMSTSFGLLPMPDPPLIQTN